MLTHRFLLAAAPTGSAPCPPVSCPCGCAGDVTIHIHHHYDSASFMESVETDARQEAADIIADLPQLRVRKHTHSNPLHMSDM